MFAAPFTELPKIVTDTTDFEREVAENLTTVGLTVELFKTAKKPPILRKGVRTEESCLTFYPESLQTRFTPKPGHGECYAERNNVRSYDWENESKYNHRYVCSYQYQPVYQPDASAELVQKAREFITSAEKVGTPTPKQPVPELLYQKNWNYFPHFTQVRVRVRSTPITIG